MNTKLNSAAVEQRADDAAHAFQHGLDAYHEDRGNVPPAWMPKELHQAFWNGYATAEHQDYI